MRKGLKAANDLQPEDETHLEIEGEEKSKKSILELDNFEARAYFLKGKHYCNFDLPEYFSFDELLLKLDTAFSKKKYRDYRPNNQSRRLEDINYKILNNKDGRYAWRSMQLINPAMYVSLVHYITEEKTWNEIKQRFKEFSKNKKIKCISIPLISYNERSDKAEQIINWWQDVEQKSIQLALDYDCLIQTDITDCYGAIYTHSLAWAMHNKNYIKQHDNRKNYKLIGNIIDGHMQDMAHGQTNGIPQGSSLMDFIAEILLGYADTLLSEEIKDIVDYHIIRYRDDYRIFVNNPRDGEKIIKSLTEVMISLGMKLSAEKTKTSHQIISSAIKSDKLYWLKQKQTEASLQKHLLIIHQLSLQHPNSGSLATAMQSYYDRLLKYKRRKSNLIALISIIVDIAHNNPRTYPISAAILSILIADLKLEHQKTAIIDKIINKFQKIPNTGHLKLWLQRITLGFKSNYEFDEPLCKIANGDKTQTLWNCSWSDQDIQKIMRETEILDQKKLCNLPEKITREEVALFKFIFDSGPE